MSEAPESTDGASVGPSQAGAPARPLTVTYYQRKPRQAGNYSLEFIFADVRRRLAGQIEARVKVARYESSGLLRRLAICLEAVRGQGDVNHVTGDTSFMGILLDGRRTVQTVLDCDFLARTSGLRQVVLRWLWLSLPLGNCAAVTAISEATKREILRHLPGYPAGKIVVIPVAISDRFRRHDKPFDRRRPRILQLGTAPNKNVPRLIEALRGLDCHLDLVGAPSAELAGLLRSSGISHDYRSNLSEEEVVRAYQDADVVSLVSTSEGFGMPILEAQAVGRPVITSGVLSMPEVAGAGACLVDPLDPAAIRAGLRRIIEDQAYREELVRLGFENARRFDPEAIARAYLDLYRQVAGRR